MFFGHELDGIDNYSLDNIYLSYNSRPGAKEVAKLLDPEVLKDIWVLARPTQQQHAYLYVLCREYSLSKEEYFDLIENFRDSRGSMSILIDSFVSSAISLYLDEIL